MAWLADIFPFFIYLNKYNFFLLLYLFITHLYFICIFCIFTPFTLRCIYSILRIPQKIDTFYSYILSSTKQTCLPLKLSTLVSNSPLPSISISAGVTAFTTKAVDALAEKYGFPRADAIEFLGLDQVTISRSSSRQSKEPKEPAVKRLTPSIPLPSVGRLGRIKQGY